MVTAVSSRIIWDVGRDAGDATDYGCRRGVGSATGRSTSRYVGGGACAEEALSAGTIEVHFADVMVRIGHGAEPATSRAVLAALRR